MPHRIPVRVLAVVAVGAVCLSVLAGCGAPSTHVTGEDNLRALAKYYGQYQGQHQGKTPPGEKPFKEFIQKKDPGAKVDELFVSQRDHEPFVVLYNQKVGMPDPNTGAPVIAYEKTGVSGKRMVARSTTAVEEVDEAKFKELVKPGS